MSVKTRFKKPGLSQRALRLAGHLASQVTRSPLEKPWFMAPVNTQVLDDMADTGQYVTALTELVTDGLTVLRGAVDGGLCDQVISDYGQWCAAYPGYVDENRDARGHEKRLINFHFASDACRDLILESGVLRFLDLLFGSEAGVYSSLTFKYGTEQPAHRDSPHFATWPRGRFAGAWFALEDIKPESGPLFYYKGAHMFQVNEAEFLVKARERLPRGSRSEQIRLALSLYNKEILEQAPAHGVKTITNVKRGDVVIWHPELPHGGLPAEDPECTRWSTVFHCSPIDTQVHQHEAFFLKPGTRRPPVPRYGFTEVSGRKMALSGDVAFTKI